MDAEDHIGEVGDESETHHVKQGSTIDAMPRTPQSEPAEQDDNTDMVTRQAVQAAATAAAALNQLALTLAQQMPSDQPVVGEISNIQNLTSVLTSIAQSVPGDQSNANGNPAVGTLPETSTAPSTPLSNTGQLDAMDQIVGAGQGQGQEATPTPTPPHTSTQVEDNIQKVETVVEDQGSKITTGNMGSKSSTENVASKVVGDNVGVSKMDAVQEEGEGEEEKQQKREQIAGEENTIEDCNQ
eukprot:TRINITY_DN9044_c1_g1_i2.p3 TRINITY_DN9044_c1_g1~~TRINITY_DN9044_c1_g1_i2.p3  ORF type:complete len:241 (-),score=66.19 TRINITY_DN9044_c1_g1_i2:712-1434(-)